MLTRWKSRVTTGAALLVAAFGGYAMTLFVQNRASQVEVAQRAQYVQQSVQLESLYRDLVKALADLSVRNQDKGLSELLAREGITVNPNAAATAGSTTDLKKGGKP